MSPVLYKAAWYELQVRNWSKAHGRRAELNSRLTGGMAPNRTTTSSVSEALKERVGRLLAVAGIFSRKWSFTIPAEKARGERLFWESRLAAVRPVGEKVKAATLVTLQPSAPAREPTSVDACTVAALDAITAFAVPNPNCSSQNQSVFSGLVARQVALLSRSLSLLRIGKVYFANPFSRRRRQT